MVVDITKEAILAGSGQTYYQSILSCQCLILAIHGLPEKQTSYVFICISLYTTKTAICSAVHCTKGTVPSVGHGSLTVADGGLELVLTCAAT